MLPAKFNWVETIVRNLVLCLLLLTSLVAVANDGREKKFSHVLLISVDGLHALDVANFVDSHDGSALAELSGKKNAEHGGFSFGDTNVGLIVSNSDINARVVKTPVTTSQVAPTILELLGIDPNALKSVRVELTPILPGLAQ